MPAWMPVSSAMDGNLAVLRYLSNTKFHLPVPGFRHPCQNDGVSQTWVYNDDCCAIERENELTRPRHFLILDQQENLIRAVMPAWMPVSSAMDGNLVVLRYLSNTKFHFPVPGFRHPCQNDGVSQTWVYNDDYCAIERENELTVPGIS